MDPTERRVALLVDEASQSGADLNGDGDSFDSVLHLYQFSTGTLKNVGLEASQDLAFVGDEVVFEVAEQLQNNTDLNGDGDTSDRIAHIYDTRTASVLNTNLAVSPLTGEFVADGNVVGFAVREDASGATDLNADGDADDEVLHVYDALAGSLTNTQLYAISEYQISGNYLAMRLPESGQGNQDFNGDGDHVGLYRVRL